MSTKIEGYVPNFEQRLFQASQIVVEDGIIRSIEPLSSTATDTQSQLPYILPGFIDSHVHIESSMLVPTEFARLAVVHGTIATVSDPHEIANVCGLEGVHFMIENGRQVPFKFFFGAPSCVPATRFETAGASLDLPAVEHLLKMPEIRYLSEMMNYPGVLNHDPEVMGKIAAAQAQAKPIDGHAPGLVGDPVRQYISTGISTDHECFSLSEALTKLKLGMKILIREGSAAKNFEALIDLLHDYPEMIMFCSDDKHPDSLIEGHINHLCVRAVKKGIDIFKILQAACLNPALHYHLDVGLLRVGDPADFIVVKDLSSFAVLRTYIDGLLVAENGKSYIQHVVPRSINNFNIRAQSVSDLKYSDSDFQITEDGQVMTIEALDGQLITGIYLYPVNLLRDENGQWSSNIKDDILKIVVVNRYKKAPITKGYVKNFGLREGALASSVAHDSHNIIAVGVDDESICSAINLIIEEKGGISFVSQRLDEGLARQEVLALPIAGLMSDAEGYQVARSYQILDRQVKMAGSKLTAPFMTLSFMALLVIPSLKISDLGLFDGENFALL